MCVAFGIIIELIHSLELPSCRDGKKLINADYSYTSATDARASEQSVSRLHANELS